MNQSKSPLQRKSYTSLPDLHARGAILVITIMACILLSASIIFIFNFGNQVNRKIVVQNSADNAAIAGGGSIARSFNNIAMNNVGMAHYISAINIIDSMPLVMDFSTTDPEELMVGDETAIYLAVVHELKRGNLPYIWQRELVRTRDKIGAPGTTDDGTDEKMLFELDDWFRNNPDAVPNATYYNAPSGDYGTLWQAMFALDTYNVEIAENFSQVAQINAANGGQHHMNERMQQNTSFMLPYNPEIPVQRGVFNDFQYPVRFGTLGPHSASRLYRGPWDALFGWRDTNRLYDAGGRTFGLPPRYRPPSRNPNADYRVIGPHDWMKRWFDNTQYGRLPYWLSRITDIKMSYLWPTKRNDSTRETLEQIIEPDWETDVEADNERSTYAGLPSLVNGDQDETRMMLNDALMEVPLSDGAADGEVNRTIWEFADDQEDAIKETLTLTLMLAHKYKEEDFDDASEYPNNSTNPTWTISPEHERHTHEHYHRGWRDFSSGPTIGGQEREWEPVGSGRYAWWTRVLRYTDPEVEQGTFPEIGLITPIVAGTYIDENGDEVIEYEPQPFYVTQYRLLVGVNVGLERIVEDPYTGFDPRSSEAPAPVTFAMAGPSSDLNHEELTFLGVATTSDEPKLFKKRFEGGKPFDGKIVGLAQAKVFNDHSWDLWTQMWQVQLVPVEDLSDWSGKAGDAEEIDSSSVAPVNEVTEAGDYLDRLEKLAEEISRH